MERRVGAVAMLIVMVLGLALAAGCAATRTDELPDDPDLIQKELVQIRMEIRNTEELIKGSKAQLQIDDNQELRSELRSLETELIHLESRQRALEERLAELAAQ